MTCRIRHSIVASHRSQSQPMATLLTLTAAELDAVLKAYKEGITEAMANRAVKR